MNMNFKAKCINNIKNYKYIKSGGFTQGKIYNVENGFLYCDNGVIWSSNIQFDSVDSINKEMQRFGVAARFKSAD